MTALPMVKIESRDFPAYISTNVVFIKKQIFIHWSIQYYETSINVCLSVSRVGCAAQTKAVKQVAGKLKFDLAKLWWSFIHIDYVRKENKALDLRLIKY